ncbi:MAG: alpha/beta hydrolase [Bacteroidales bacterium]
MNRKKGITDYTMHCAAGCQVSERRLENGEGTVLNCVTFTNAAANGSLPVVFIPGLASVMENFSGVLKGMTSGHTLHFVETREKKSSRIKEGSSFTMKDIASDISMAVRELGMKENEYILAGYSLGAMAAAESFGGILTVKPRLLVMAEPSCNFHVGPFGLFIAKYLWWTYPVIKPLIKLYFRLFRIDTGGDYEMYTILTRVLDSADPKKLASALVGLTGYQISSSLAGIDVPVLVIGVSGDKLHGNNCAGEVAARLRDASFTDLGNNKRSHSGEVAELTEKRLATL